MAFEDNKVLFGHDAEERIVAVEFDGNGLVRLYLREPDGSTSNRPEKLRPFLWCAARPKAELGKGATVRELDGDLPLKFLVECATWEQFIRTRMALKNEGASFFALGDAPNQYLFASGKTLFKGMEWSDLRRMQIVLEKEAIVLADSSGWSEALGRSELARLTGIIRARDPDVIEGHDLFKKTLPALAAHARNARVKLTWGRDGSVLESRSSRLQIAEKTINYPKYEVHGRHFVDTFLLAQIYDVTARGLPSFELGDVAEYLHIREADAIAQTRELAAALSASYFVQAKIFPYNYQDVIVRGNGTRVNVLLLREYHRRGHAIPNLPTARDYEGGYTDIFFTGIARDVWHCDVASLYPSLMLRFDCFPANDRLGIIRGLLGDLRKFRLEAKGRMRAETDRAKRASLHATQATFKILINAIYGYMGFSQAHFADYDAAARVTEMGRDLLEKMTGRLRELGAHVIEIDTDGIYFVPPKGAPVETLQRGVEEILPGGIEVEFDEQYAAMFSYKAKNYALLTKEGELVIRGGALKSRGLEKFQRVFLEEMIRLLMEGRPGEVEKMRADFEAKIRSREWPIEWLMKTDTLQDSLGQYQRKIQGSSRNRAAAYELALKSGRDYQPGDKVSYYITGAKKNVSAYENSKLASEWDEKARDENVEYYVAKLNELKKKFAEFLQPSAPAEPAQMGLL